MDVLLSPIPVMVTVIMGEGAVMEGIVETVGIVKVCPRRSIR